MTVSVAALGQAQALLATEAPTAPSAVVIEPSAQATAYAAMSKGHVYVTPVTR